MNLNGTNVGQILLQFTGSTLEIRSVVFSASSTLLWHQLSQKFHCNHWSTFLKQWHKQWSHRPMLLRDSRQILQEMCGSPRKCHHRSSWRKNKSSIQTRSASAFPDQPVLRPPQEPEVPQPVQHSASSASAEIQCQLSAQHENNLDPRDWLLFWVD